MDEIDWLKWQTYFVWIVFGAFLVYLVVRVIINAEKRIAYENKLAKLEKEGVTRRVVAPFNKAFENEPIDLVAEPYGIATYRNGQRAIMFFSKVLNDKSEHVVSRWTAGKWFHWTIKGKNIDADKFPFGSSDWDIIIWEPHIHHPRMTASMCHCFTPPVGYLGSAEGVNLKEGKS